MLDVMGVAEGESAAREAAAGVALGQCAPQGGGDGARSAADVDHRSVGGVGHDDGRGVAGDAAGRFS
jgi:hypothetical protein